MLESLRGREIVLAGGSGGIGTAVTKSLLEEGAKVIVSYLHQAERALALVPSECAVRADLAVVEDRRRLLDSAPSLYGLVILAGVPARLKDPSLVSEMMLESHRSNYEGPILLAQEAAARMKRSGIAGSIVLLSTMQANALFPGSTVYAAEKAALQHAARILAKEYRGPGGVRINVVSPGVTAAGMAEASIAAGKYYRFIQEGTIERFGHADDVARAIRFFLEPDNYITGQVLCVDGGMTL